MDLESFLLESPLLWVVFSILAVGILARLSFFLIALFKSDKRDTSKWTYIPAAVGRAVVPLHRVVVRRPIYTILRCIFHICLAVVPIGLSGHIALLESSALEWSWPALPDNLADAMTLVFIALSVLFLVRRIVMPKIRHRSSAFDYIFIIICLLPFLSGYFLAHSTLDAVPFLADNMLSIHILSSCLMIVGTVFLFLRSRLDKKTCTGCAACEITCPTGTLASIDKGIQRIFNYSHYRCVSCGACIAACPEFAAELRHEFSPGSFFRVLERQPIRSVELKVCERCGGYFAPTPQVEKVGETIHEEYLHFCPKCKETLHADTFRRMLPWTKKS